MRAHNDKFHSVTQSKCCVTMNQVVTRLVRYGQFQSNIVTHHHIHAYIQYSSVFAWETVKLSNTTCSNRECNPSPYNSYNFLCFCAVFIFTLRLCCPSIDLKTKNQRINEIEGGGQQKWCVERRPYTNTQQRHCELGSLVPVFFFSA